MYGQPPYGAPMMRAPQPPLDLYAAAKRHALRKLWISILMTGGGLLLTLLGLATGFLIFIGIALIVGGIVRFVQALAAMTDPTRSLKNLGPNEVLRRQALRVAEAELSHPAVSVLQLPAGAAALMGPSWFAYHDKGSVLVARREDILWYYVEQRRRQRTLKVHLRAFTIAELDVGGGEGQLLYALGQAAPHALAGFDPRWAATPQPILAQEVDRRRWEIAQQLR